MMHRIVRSISLCAAFVVAAIVATPSQAMPAFARQTGKACSTCHFQHYPALNAYGQEFKAGGYTDVGKQPLIKGNDLSLPSILNAALFFKFRYQDTNGKDLSGTPTAASGDWQVPDEFALLLGGRVTENIGFMLEGQLKDSGAPFLAGFKMPAMYKIGESTVKAGVVPYTTDSLGASYGFELLNTGAVRNVRIAEHRSETSAQQYIGTATAATGAAIVAVHPMFFANLSRWTPNHGSGGVSGQKLSSTYLRAAFTPSVGEWELGGGVQSWSGKAKDATGIGVNETKAWAIDFQAQGAVGSYPLGVYLTHANAAGTAAGSTTPNLFNGNPDDKKATVILGELGFLPGKATVQLAYRWADTGDVAANHPKDNAWTVGATYQIAQNAQLQVQHTSRSKGGAANVGRYDGSDTPGSALTTFMLSAGF